MAEYETAQSETPPAYENPRLGSWLKTDGSRRVGLTVAKVGELESCRTKRKNSYCYPVADESEIARVVQTAGRKRILVALDSAYSRIVVAGGTEEDVLNWNISRSGCGYHRIWRAGCAVGAGTGSVCGATA